MKSTPFLLFLFLCSFPLSGQITTIYRSKADSCAKAGNFRAADSLYTLVISILPEAQDYTARANLRLKTSPCSACGDFFKAATMGDSLAVKKIRTHCYREKKEQNCATDSFSIFYAKGKVTMKQKLDNGYYSIRESDTAFRNIQTHYLSGKDTLRQFSETCTMPDSLRFKMYKYIGDNNRSGNAFIISFVIGLYSKPSENDSSVNFNVTFSHDGVVLDAQTAGGVRHDYLDDAFVLKLLNTMPPLGNWGCDPGAYRYTFVIYFSHQW